MKEAYKEDTMLLDTHLKKIAWSNFFAQFSEQIALAAAPLVAVLFLAASASDTAWLQAIQTLPFLICAIPAGVLADRISRRNMMIMVEIARTLILSILILLLVLKLITFSLLMILGFIAAIGTVCYSVAIPAYVPTIVQKDELMATNRWLELVRSLAFSASPALCGVIVANLGMPIAYAIATLFSITTIMFLMILPKDNAPAVISSNEQKKRNIKRELTDGWLFIRHNDYLRPILLTAIFFNTSWFIIQGIFVAYAINTMSFNVQNVGIILGIYGTGIAALFAGYIGAKSCLWLALIGFTIQLTIIISSKIPALKTLTEAI